MNMTFIHIVKKKKTKTKKKHISSPLKMTAVDNILFKTQVYLLMH